GAEAPLELATHGRFHLAIGPEGRYLLAFGFDAETDRRPGELARWEQPADGPPKLAWRLPMPARNEWVAELALDPRARWLVTRDGFAGAVVDQVFALSLRSPKMGGLERKVPMPGRTAEELVFSPDGRWLVVRAGMSLLVWDADDWDRKPRKVKNTTRLHFLALAFHPSGGHLAATDNDRTVKVYETGSWGLVRTFDWEAGRPRSGAGSPDGCLRAARRDRAR